MASSKMDPTLTPMSLAVPMYDIGIQANLVFASCPGGTNECMGSGLATALSSPVHDEKLIEATRKINHVLREVAEHRKDRELMLINVGGEVLLAWTTPKLPEGVETIKDLREIRRILRVQPGMHKDHDTQSSDCAEEKND